MFYTNKDGGASLADPHAADASLAEKAKEEEQGKDKERAPLSSVALAPPIMTVNQKETSIPMPLARAFEARDPTRATG